MPRQTGSTGTKDIILPDGFNLSISTDGGTAFVDVGVIAGGATATLNWDDYKVDAGNYKGLIRKFVNPSVALAPSDILNFNPDVVNMLFAGFTVSADATSPVTGKDISYVGGDKYGDLTSVQLKLTHYTVDNSSGSETDTNIDWQFTLYNAYIDAGGSFTFNGNDTTDLSRLSVSFTGEPDYANSNQLFSFFSTFKEA